MSDPHQTKQVLVIRRDLKMRRGKEVSQGAHASWGWALQNMDFIEDTAVIKLTEDQRRWLLGSQTKVTCQVNGEAELMAVWEAAKSAGLPATYIYDEGRTEFQGRRTLTAVAVGPASTVLVDAVTGHLTLY